MKGFVLGLALKQAKGINLQPGVKSTGSARAPITRQSR